MKHIDDVIRERLKIAVERSGLSQSKVAERAGVSRINLNRLFAGARQGVSPETIYKICKALDVPMAFIFGEIDEYQKSDGTLLAVSPAPQEKLSHGQLLKQLLEAKKLSQTEAAEMIGMDRKVFSNYVRDEREPNMQMWQRISIALSVPVGYFYNEVSLDEALKHEVISEERLGKLNKLHRLLKELDEEDLEKIIEVTEKEKIYKDYTKMMHSKKTS